MDLSQFFTTKDIIIYSILLVIVLFTLYKLNIIGATKGVKKATRQKEKEKSDVASRKRAIFLMKQFNSIYMFIGNTTEEYMFELKYLLERNNVQIKALGRKIKPEEVVGIFRFLQIVVVAADIVIVSVTLNITMLALLGLVFLPKLYTVFLRIKILAEDEELENDFPDLYLLLYSRLKKGSHTQIEPTMKDYIRSLDDMYGKGESHLAIRSFCSRFSANVEVYGDEVTSVKHLREHYRSPTIVNFCNLAIQALTGVDNREKLLTFKQELAEDRRVKMDLKAAALVKKGTTAINIIYVILFEFIILSWVSKIDLSLFDSFLG